MLENASVGVPLFQFSRFSRFFIICGLWVRRPGAVIQLYPSDSPAFLSWFSRFALSPLPELLAVQKIPSLLFCSYFFCLLKPVYLFSFGCSYFFFVKSGFAVLFTLSSPFSCLAFALPTSGLRMRLWDFSFSYSLVSGYSILLNQELVNRFFKLFWKNLCIFYKPAAYDYFAGIKGQGNGQAIEAERGESLVKKTDIRWFLPIHSWL